MDYAGTAPQPMYPNAPGTTPQPTSPYATPGAPANPAQGQINPNQINQVSQPGLPNLAQMGQGFAGGGSVGQAKGLASLGRGQDSMLVHMTPGEVHGLQQLAQKHGGSLTTNPHTGLPEAGFLSNMLPTLLGIAAGAVTMNPMIGAAVGGGLGYAKHGSLMEGLSAGFGAYSGAGLLGGLESAGTAAATNEGAALAGQQAGATAAQSTAALGQDAAAQQAASKLAIDQASGSFTAPKLDMFDPARLDRIKAGMPTSWDSAKTFFNATPTGEAASGLSNKTALLGLGVSSLSAMSPNMSTSGAPIYEPDEYDKAMARYKMSKDFKVPTVPQPDYYKPSYTNYKYADGGNVAGAQGSTSPIDSAGNPLVYDPLTGLYKPAANAPPIYGLGNSGSGDAPPAADAVGNDPAGTADASGGNDAPSGTGEPGNGDYALGGQIHSKYASGGHLPRPDVGIAHDNDPDTASLDPYAATMARLKKINTRANMPLKYGSPPVAGIKGLGNIQPMATGGQLGGYSDGGHLLKGPGDGMSDSIPASINKKQPAALADGEFVVPADVVSHLGNGSTDAGAKRLYAMMDKIRQARTGNPKQGKQINPNKFLPK